MYNNFEILNTPTVKRYFSKPVEYFHSLTAPNIFSLISYDDEYTLLKIARSSKSIKKKLREIDEIMKKYLYFKKIGVGTNRVIYKNLNCEHQVLKIAFDSVALQDGPREYVNQKYLLPLCTKIFEVSPNNVITSSEYVDAIKTYDEFGLYSDIVYDIIVDKFIANGFLLDDIGFSFYKNWGLRFGFPILLDFPYLYKFNDPSQLKCHNEINGNLCSGYLEYDEMFNYLYCPVCGKRDIPLDSTGLKVNNEPYLNIQDTSIITELSVFAPKVKLIINGKDYILNNLPSETKYIENLNRNDKSSLEELIDNDDF